MLKNASQTYSLGMLKKASSQSQVKPQWPIEADLSDTGGHRYRDGLIAALSEGNESF